MKLNSAVFINDIIKKLNTFCVVLLAYSTFMESLPFNVVQMPS